MALVRPHIAGIMGIALAGSWVLQRRLPLGQRVFLGGAALAATAAIVPFALTYAGLGEASGTDDILNYVEQRQSVNTQGSSSVDIASMSLPVQRSEEHTSELQSLMRISYAVFCLKKKKNINS